MIAKAITKAKARPRIRNGSEYSTIFLIYRRVVAGGDIKVVGSRSPVSRSCQITACFISARFMFSTRLLFLVTGFFSAAVCLSLVSPSGVSTRVRHTQGYAMIVFPHLVRLYSNARGTSGGK